MLSYIGETPYTCTLYIRIHGETLHEYAVNIYGQATMPLPFSTRTNALCRLWLEGASHLGMSQDGAAAAILCSEAFVKKHGLEASAVEILAMSLRTDTRATFDQATCMRLVGYDMSKDAAADCYRQAGVGSAPNARSAVLLSVSPHTMPLQHTVVVLIVLMGLCVCFADRGRVCACRRAA